MPESNVTPPGSPQLIKRPTVVKRSRTRGAILTITGVLLPVLGAVLKLVLGSSILGPGWWILAVLLVLRGTRHYAAAANDLLLKDPRPPVLYLRSFRADAATKRLPWWRFFLSPAWTWDFTSEEEHLAAALSTIGPPIAIGKPGESLPQLGVARLYVSHEEWQATVRSYSEVSRLVVLRLGETEGFWWELQNALKTLPPEKLLLLVPFTRIQYDAFREKAKSCFAHSWPEYPKTSEWGYESGLKTLRGLIYFRADWTPAYVDLAQVGPKKGVAARFFGSTNLGTTLSYALRPIVDQVRSLPEPPRMATAEPAEALPKPGRAETAGAGTLNSSLRRRLLLIAAAASILSLGAAGWWRIAAVLDARQQAHASIAAQISALGEQAPPALFTKVGTAVRVYLEGAPQGYRSDVEQLWTQRSAAWEAARTAEAKQLDAKTDELVRSIQVRLGGVDEKAASLRAEIESGGKITNEAAAAFAKRIDDIESERTSLQSQFLGDLGAVFTRISEIRTGSGDAVTDEATATVSGAESRAAVSFKDVAGRIESLQDLLPADFFFQSGNAKGSRGDFAGAIADYSRAIALSPNEGAAYNNRGNARFAKDDYAGAMADYERAIALNPNGAAAYNNRGRLKAIRYDLVGAISDFDRAIALDPSFSEAYANRGRAKYNRRDFDGAIADCDRAIALNPNLTEPRDLRNLLGKLTGK